MSTIQAAAGPIIGLISPNRSNAQSEPARRLFIMQEEIREYLLTSCTVRDPRERLLDELDNLCVEASRRGWDGYAAEPVTPDAYDFAKMFIKALPTTAPLPELNADPDGEVALDWSFGHRRALTVSICLGAWNAIKPRNRLDRG